MIRFLIEQRGRYGDGPWYIELSRELFHTYAGAAKRAFELNDESVGYMYRPVEVTVRAVEEQNKVLAGDWEPGEAPGEDDCECLDDHGTYEETHCMGCAALLPDAVEPWDGLFVGQYFVNKLNENGSLSSVNLVNEPLSVPETMRVGEALFGYAG